MRSIRFIEVINFCQVRYQNCLISLNNQSYINREGEYLNDFVVEIYDQNESDFMDA